MYQQLPENKMAAEMTISRHLYHCHDIAEILFTLH